MLELIPTLISTDKNNPTKQKFMFNYVNNNWLYRLKCYLFFGYKKWHSDGGVIVECMGKHQKHRLEITIYDKNKKAVYLWIRDKALKKDYPQIAAEVLSEFLGKEVKPC